DIAKQFRMAKPDLDALHCAHRQSADGAVLRILVHAEAALNCGQDLLKKILCECRKVEKVLRTRLLDSFEWSDRSALCRMSVRHHYYPRHCFGRRQRCVENNIGAP